MGLNYKYDETMDFFLGIMAGLGIIAFVAIVLAFIFINVGI